MKDGRTEDRDDRVHPDDVALLGDMSLPRLSARAECHLLHPVLAALADIITNTANTGSGEGVTA